MLLLLASCSHGDDGPVTVRCNAKTYSEDDSYSVSKVYMLQMLLTNTPWASDHDIYKSFTHNGVTAYGHATCSRALDTTVCEACLNFVMHQATTICGRSVGAQVVYMDNCTVRYENYAFTD
ncbi:hypothetical protein HU200_015789 [Digitaria exilis]|uniref:Gnk2-homologous domain-containing protein n=1 Tax=Digitaria exilis TaxID=1010633 RepID=A0A835KHK0_9POAL|nr:hypothetical protein HU200_015789 [Digitaria exilis]